MTKKKKEKRHRHKWEQNFIGCPNCGLERILECGCGEWKDNRKIKVKS